MINRTNFINIIAEIRVIHDAAEAAQDAADIYTDSWMSYGIPAKKEEERKKTFIPFQVI